MRPAPIAEIGNHYVHPDHRGHGLGEQLVQRFARWAREQHADSAEVSAYTANSRAIRFHQRHGFAPQELTLRADLRRAEKRWSPARPWSPAAAWRFGVVTARAWTPRSSLPAAWNRDLADRGVPRSRCRWVRGTPSRRRVDPAILSTARTFLVRLSQRSEVRSANAQIWTIRCLRTFPHGTGCCDGIAVMRCCSLADRGWRW